MIERDPRFPNAAPVFVSGADFKTEVLLVDLTNRGAKLLGLCALPFGTVVTLRKDDEAIDATVRWSRTGLTGLEFDVMLGPKFTELMRRFRGVSRRGARRVGSFGFSELACGGQPDGMQEEAAPFDFHDMAADTPSSPFPPAAQTTAQPISPTAPRPRRHGTHKPITVHHRGRPHASVIVNYSKRGLGLRDLPDAQPGDSISVPLNGLVIWGAVRWVSDGQVGAMLTLPLSSAQQRACFG